MIKSVQYILENIDVFNVCVAKKIDYQIEIVLFSYFISFEEIQKDKVVSFCTQF